MRKLITFVFIAILLLLNLNFIRGSLQSYVKLSEINEEQHRVKEFELKNSQLKQELQDRESLYFIEQEARNRLGFSKPGETTIVVESSKIEELAKKENERQKTNLQSWLELIKH